MLEPGLDVRDGSVNLRNDCRKDGQMEGSRKEETNRYEVNG